MDFSTLPITHQQTIPEEYLDFLRHMNIMYYTHLIDVANFNFYDRIEFGKKYHTESGNGSFALEEYTRYLAEVRAGESLTIRTRMLGVGHKTFHLIHFIIKDEGQVLAATTEMLSIHIDMGTRLSSPLPDEIAHRFQAYLRDHEKLSWPAPVSGSMNVK